MPCATDYAVNVPTGTAAAKTQAGAAPANTAKASSSRRPSANPTDHFMQAQQRPRFASTAVATGFNRGGISVDVMRCSLQQ